LHLPQPRRRRWRHAVPAAGPEDIPLDLIQTRTFGSRVISKRYLQALAMSWTDIVLRWQICIMAVSTSPARLDGLPTLPGVEHHWVDVQTGSGPVRLHLAASGSGPPVLLLHGWPQHWWCWRGVVEQLRDSRLLIPDLRGFRWSEAPGSGYSPTGFADDAVALLDALDIARAHDRSRLGGFAGFLLGLRHSERVHRLLLCNSPGPWARAEPTDRRWPSAGMVWQLPSWATGWWRIQDSSPGFCG